MMRTLLSRYVRIANEILMHLRSTRRTRAEVSLYDPIGVDKEGNELTFYIYRYEI
jgi:RNA polymerase sporulation-specific sigma factor